MRTIQLWPRGESVTISESQYDHVADDLVKVDGQWVEPSAELKRKIDIELCAERLLEHEVLCCDSSLVTDLMEAVQSGDHGTGMSGEFCWDQVENIYVDPSDWGVEQCHKYLQDEGGGEPIDDNPWGMEREELEEFLGIDTEDADYEEASMEHLLKEAIGSIDDDMVGDLDAWREAVQNHSQENPKEPLEWWRVSQYLCEELRAIGEIVLDNDYGYWWGRTCSGQAMIMDGTLQEVAERIMSR